jgi:glucokinase
MILTEIRKYYLGIDLGGTFIKGGIVDDTGRILIQDQTPTESQKGADTVIANIAELCRSLLARTELTAEDITGIGMGVPGMIDSGTGTVTYSNNLAWKDLALAHKLEEIMHLPVRIANDANVAALGETKFGAGKRYKSTVMITLGTGVGSGIVMDGRPLEGNHAAGAELGHTVIVAGGESCTCGRRGCLEAYASATALIRDTKRAMEAHPESRMWEIGSLDAVNGKTAFDFADTDAVAGAVVENYIEMLGVGIVNVANALRPEAIILGGGVCNQGEALLHPLRKILARDIFAGDKGPSVDLVIGEQGNTAGLLGAAALWM